MRRLQKLVRCGNSTHVTLSPQMTTWLGWLPGESVIVELTENKTVVIRRPSADDFAPKRMVAVLLDGSMPVAR
jgi:antitoxin component of MazEF toxin-antitoxin module